MLSLACPAKINLFLEVTEKRADGYHNLESVFLAIDLADTLAAFPAESNAITLECDAPGVPLDENNLIVKAASLLRRESGAGGGGQGIRFVLDKKIPMGGGLGGGSSDAAAALRLANRIWNAGLADSDLAELGGRLGSDVPFFFRRGACLCRGRGEITAPLPPPPEGLAIGLVVSNIHSDTAAAYRGLRLPAPGERRSAGAFVRAMAAGDIAAMAGAAFNRFEKTVFAALPELAAIRDVLTAATGLAVRMSGSGSALWFFGNADDISDIMSHNNDWRALAEQRTIRILPAGVWKGL